MGGQYPENVSLQQSSQTFLQEPEANRQIESMVLYPTVPPNPVLPRRLPGFSGGKGMFPRGNGGTENLNWRAEGLRAPTPRFGAAYPLPEYEQCPSTSGAFYRQQREKAPPGNQEEVQQKESFQETPQESTIPSIPQYKSCST